jgi:hypothetical protein
MDIAALTTGINRRVYLHYLGHSKNTKGILLTTATIINYI